MQAKIEKDKSDLIEKYLIEKMDVEQVREIISNSTKLHQANINPFKNIENLQLYLPKHILEEVAQEIFVKYDALASIVSKELAAHAFCHFRDIEIKDFNEIPDVQKSTNSYNAITERITQEILQTKSYAERILIMERWALILAKSWALGDYQSCLAISAALEQVPICRLNKGLSDRALQIMSKVREANENSSNKNKKQLFKEYGIPYLGAYQNQITLAKEVVQGCDDSIKELNNPEEKSDELDIKREEKIRNTQERRHGSIHKMTSLLVDLQIKQLLLDILNDNTNKYRTEIDSDFYGCSPLDNENDSTEKEAGLSIVDTDLYEISYSFHPEGIEFSPQKTHQQEYERLMEIEELKNQKAKKLNTKKQKLKNQSLERIEESMENIAIALKQLYLFIYEEIGCELFVRSKLPQDFAEYKESYIYLRNGETKQLYYIKSDGTAEKVTINNLEQFEKELNDIKKRKQRVLPLSGEQIRTLITKNGDHVRERGLTLDCFIKEVNEVLQVLLFPIKKAMLNEYNIKEFSHEMIKKYEEIFEKNGINKPDKIKELLELIIMTTEKYLENKKEYHELECQQSLSSVWRKNKSGGGRSVWNSYGSLLFSAKKGERPAKSEDRMAENNHEKKRGSTLFSGLNKGERTAKPLTEKEIRKMKDKQHIKNSCNTMF
ncbi:MULTISPECIES: RasGEF domain-containing protein [Legionella]|uniref:RasGEF domain protein n=1 Tax=Legionella drozanskii LLAP-1 TaxID=1212489 RepID=A0A0W0SX27_9GAMM|nr:MULTISPECIES: RasGEF domain-containing protein [Legionella]KTC87859.1 RasGEF domain protein [Legionella drozanskii LLAP-1]PJE09082.1 MAG: hypothetical protein CK430_11400 [Legionella sp.]